MLKQKLKKLIISFVFSFSTLVFAENFRIAKLFTVNVSEDSDFTKTEVLSLNDSVAIFLPDSMEYIDGLEVRFEIPEEIALQKSCCEFSIYDSVQPAPKSDQIDYSGNRIFRGVIPGKLSWIVQIPFSQNNNLKSNLYTTKIGQIPDLKENYLFIKLRQLLPVLPPELEDSRITVTIKPILSNKGKLNIKLICPDDNLESCAIYIDDYAYNMNTINNGILLDSGIHSISVISEYYRTEVRKIRIDQAKQTDISITMKSIEPTLLVIAPGGVKIYIDDEVCHTIGKEFIISEGKHKLRFSVGDYEVIRSFNVIKGKSYKANIAIDFQIQEE
ncbi:MAG: hypothetical protein SOW31_03675 [Treponema sp.]|nr:hypothetical protein [Treponema sp.]MCI5667098.1 hypothetical protein [Spirochaetia bacterium]MDD7768341.1 hypothetical protein [Treponema sp.]MDY3130807.1 hypothetical protein [Treponema sp.]